MPLEKVLTEREAKKLFNREVIPVIGGAVDRFRTKESPCLKPQQTQAVRITFFWKAGEK